MRLFVTRSPNDHKRIFQRTVEAGRLTDRREQGWTWVVSDLRTKLELQSELLKYHDVIEQDSIMRASELWSRLVMRQHPHLRLLSPELATALIDGWLTEIGFELAGRPGATSLVYEAIGGLLPLLTHNQGREIASEWFADNPDSEKRWRPWYEVASKVWDRFLHEGVATRSWVVGLLVTETIPREIWSRNLIVDVGAQLSSAEAEILIELQRQREVEVLVPESGRHQALRAYEKLSQAGAIQWVAETEDESSHPGSRADRASVHLRRWTSALAEVKGAVSEINRLRQSHSLEDLAIVAPDIETYWPTLVEHLEAEGIPVEKACVASLHQFPEVSLWLARIRLAFGGARATDLRAHFRKLKASGQSRLDEDQFRYLFTRIYDREDLARAPDFSQFLEVGRRSSEVLKRDEFIISAIAQFPVDEAPDRAIQLMRSIVQDCPGGFRLSTKGWISYLENRATRTSVAVDRPGFGADGGLIVANLAEIDGAWLKGVVVLGLDGTSLQGPPDALLSMSELQMLERRYGLVFPQLHRAKALEFDLEWLLQSESAEVTLSYAERDSLGLPRAPSVAWLKRGLKVQASQPSSTGFDLSLSRHPGPPTRAYSSSLARPLKISASLLDQYIKCPFLALTQGVFGLQDPGALDLDVDPRKAGSLAHEVLAQILGHQRLDWSKAEILALIESARVSAETGRSRRDPLLANQTLWAGHAERLAVQIQRTLEAEKRYETFRSVQVLERELEFTGIFRPTASTWHAEADRQAGDIDIKGRIDRVDCLPDGRLVVIDYKSSGTQAVLETAAKELSSLQLTVYIAALEQGWTRLGASRVAGGFYQVIRDGTRAGGRWWGEGPWERFGLGEPLPEDEFRLVQDNGMRKATQIATLMSQGSFSPLPDDPQICDECEWRLTCHADHLIR